MSKIVINPNELVELPPVTIGFDNLIGYYQLLKYLSNQYEGQTIFDGGTFKGHSAAVLAMNRKNKIITCDVVEQDTPYINKRRNVTKYKCGINEIVEGILLNSVFMFIDIDHIGSEEKIFFDKLIRIGYSGYTLWDDIRIFKDIWDSFDIEKKYEVPIFHPATSFGIIDFGDNICLQE